MKKIFYQRGVVLKKVAPECGFTGKIIKWFSTLWFLSKPDDSRRGPYWRCRSWFCSGEIKRVWNNLNQTPRPVVDYHFAWNTKRSGVSLINTYFDGRIVIPAQAAFSPRPGMPSIACPSIDLPSLRTFQSRFCSVPVRVQQTSRLIRWSDNWWPTTSPDYPSKSLRTVGLLDIFKGLGHLCLGFCCVV